MLTVIIKSKTDVIPEQSRFFILFLYPSYMFYMSHPQLWISLFLINLRSLKFFSWRTRHLIEECSLLLSNLYFRILHALVSASVYSQWHITKVINYCIRVYSKRLELIDILSPTLLNALELP
jgi:hypothetical protein